MTSDQPKENMALAPPEQTVLRVQYVMQLRTEQVNHTHRFHTDVEVDNKLIINVVMPGNELVRSL